MVTFANCLSGLSGDDEDFGMNYSNGNGLLQANADALAAKRKTPESFLGANSNLVNLDALVSTKTISSKSQA